MKRSRTKLALLAFLGMMSVVNAWAQDVVKNTRTNTSYATLQDAFYEANSGDVLELLSDVDATGENLNNADYNLSIEAGITLEGNNHTLTVNRRGISVAPQSSNSRMMGAPAKAPGNTIDVTIQNLTIKNVAAQVNGRGGRIINTRGGIGTLTLNNVTFDTQNTAYNREVRPLVIGGSQSTEATVNITGCTFSTPTALAINVFNPVTMNIQNTTINAQNVIYLGGANSSYGSQGSEVTFNGSTVNASAGAAVLFDVDNTGANGSTVTLAGETKVTTPTADWYDLGNTENTIVWEHFATNFISATKYETKPTIQIATVADLLAMATLCNNALTSGQTAGNTYELVNDLDLSSVDNWTPAGGLDGYSGTAFKGTFDGKNHTISNLTCTDTHPNYATAALFGATSSNAVIKNLTLANVNIHSTHYAAAFVAYESSELNYSTIENCHVNGGSIVSTPELLNGEYDNGDKVGGIVGYSVRTDIKNCSVENVTLQGYRDIGGLAGFMQEHGAVIEGNTVANVTIIQNDENGYKTNSDGSLQDMSNTIGEVVGGRSGAAVIAQANDPSKNVANNVTIEFTGVLAKIGEAKFSTVSAAVAAATEGQTVEIYVADTYTLPNLPKNITIEGKVDGVVFSHTSAGNIASVPNGATFKNVTFNFGSVNYHGFQQARTINMEGCTLNGKFFSYGDMNFVGCTFNAPGTEESGITSKDYSMWAYSGNLTYTDCTFNCNGKCINVYNESVETLYTITAKNCTFNSETANKAAFNVKATCEATSGSKPLKFKVIIEDCEATGSWPAASVSETLVVLNALAQVDDIKAGVASDIEVMEIEDGVETVHYPARVAEYKGTRYNTLAEALDAAEAANDKNIVINLLNDAELTIAAWSGSNNRYAIGTAETETITINGNEHKLTFMTTDTDWNNVATMNDAQTKLVLNNMTLDQGGRNTNGTWNAYDINFNCAVELKNVTSNRPIALKNDAALNNVTINVDESKDVYGLWIQTNGQSVSIDGLTMNVPNGRGIGIKDEYVNEEPASITELTIENATFNTKKKAAILVTSKYGAEINASNLNIENAVADNVNAVWVDEDRAEEYYKVTTTGATMTPEGGESAYVSSLVRGEQTRGYYKTFAAAYASTDYAEGDTYKLHQSTSEAVEVAKELTIVKNGFTAENLTAGEDYTKNETEEEIAFVELPDVAQIGETGYKTLQKAVDAAHEMTGDVTITLLDNISGYAIVHQKAGLNLTIDGADKTLAGQIIIDGDGQLNGTDALTIQNIQFEMPSEFCTGTDAFVVVPNTKTANTPYYAPSHNNHAHNITISNCSFTGDYPTSGVVAIKTHSGTDGTKNLIMENVTATNLHSLAQLTAVTDASFDNCSATLTGSFIGANGGGGNYTVSNCTFESHPDKADGYAYREKSSSTAVATLTNNNFKAHDAIILGSAGTINVESGTYVGDISKTAGTIAISGGQFSVDLTDAAYESFIAEGMIGVKNDEVEGAPYSVEEGTYVAKVTVGETTHNYSSLEAAFADAEDGATITLLADCAGNGIKVPQGKYSTGLTVDFGGFTYTVDGTTVGSTGTETQAFQLLKDNNITFMNGTIYSEVAKMLVQNYSNLTLEGMTLTLNNSSYTSAYTLSNNNGNVVIDGTTINANPAGGFAFDVCRYSSYPSVNVEVKGDSEINGDIEIYASGSDAKEGFGLTLTAGTLNGNIVLDASATAAMEATPEKAVITKADSFEAAAPADYKWVSNGDGTSTLAPKVYLAQIGDVKYESLAEAVAAVPADGTQTTITMIANEMINVVGSAITIPANKNVVLDLNGYQVVGTAEGGSTSALITNKGTLTIKDSSDTNADGTGTGKLISGATTTWIYDGSGNYSGSYASNTITNSGTLNIESGYIENLSTGSATYAVDNNSSGGNAILNMNGGLLKAHSVAVREFANSTTNENTVNVSGGTITAGYSGIWIQLPGSDATKAMKAALNVTGGTLTGGSYAFYDYTYGNAYTNTQFSLDGGTFNGDIFSYGANINITDGTYNGEVAIKQTKPSTVAVSGGTFEGDVYTYGDNASEAFISGGQFAILTYEYEGETYDCDWTYLLAPGYVRSAEPNENGYYTVKLGVAKIGVTGYPTFTAAVEAATEDDVITLLADIAEPYTLSLDETLKVALDGHTLTVESAVVGFEASGSLDENGVTTYTLVPRDMSDEDIVLIDGEPYEYIRDAQVKSATYVRTTKSTQTGKYQPWLVPFDYTITENDLEKFKFYKLNMVANSPNVEEEATDDKIWVFVKPMKAGDVLYANKPYAFKPKEVVTNYEFTTQNAKLKARANGSVLEMATSDATYSFYGNYETTDLIYSDGYRDYYMGGGKLYFIEDGYPVTLGSYRWYLRSVAKDGNYSRGITFFEVDDEVTGIDNTVAGEEMVTYYTLDGVQVKTPGKGIYIMRFANGKTKKVSIK